MLSPCGACNTAIKMLVVLALLLVEAWGQNCRLSRYLSPTSASQPIESPGYPGSYPASLTCYYYYYTDPGYRLAVDCHDVEMGLVPWDCSDRLNFLGSFHDNINFCSPINVESVDHRIMLILTTSNISQGGRFACTIRAKRSEPCDCGWSQPKRIVGGTKTEVNEFPFMVSIVNAQLRQHTCGGAIVSPRFVLTAAHCLRVLRVQYTGLLVGEHDMSTGTETNATRLHRAVEFIVHPDYNSDTSWNDIGLIRSATSFAFSMRVGPVCLPFNRPNLPEVYDYLTAMGWGTIDFGGPTSDVLLKVRLQVVPQSRCIASFNQSASSGSQVCTFTPGKDTCQMDSGGPLVAYDPRTARMFLAAIVSYGGACGGDDPAVNTRVASFVEWIRETTKENFCIR